MIEDLKGRSLYDLYKSESPDNQDDEGVKPNESLRDLNLAEKFSGMMEEGFSKYIKEDENLKNQQSIDTHRKAPGMERWNKNHPLVYKKLSENPPITMLGFINEQRENWEIEGTAYESESQFFRFIVLKKDISSVKEYLDNRANYKEEDEIASFYLGVDFWGKGSNTSSLTHRYISPEARGTGLGTTVLKTCEQFLTQFSEKRGKTQSNKMEIFGLDMMLWAEKNGYKPVEETEENTKKSYSQIWREVLAGQTEEGEKLLMGESNWIYTESEYQKGPEKRNPLSMRFEKKFNSVTVDDLEETVPRKVKEVLDE